MNNYVTNNLSKNEKVIQTAKINFLAIIPQIIICAIFLALFFAFQHFISIIPEDGNEKYKILIFLTSAMMIMFSLAPILNILEILSLEVAVTNKRIIGKKGLFNTTAINIPISQISNANVSLSFFGKIFNYATVEISSTGMKIVKGNSQIMKLKAITNSYEFLNSINSAIDENAEQQRIFQAEAIAKAMNKE
ncbi:MAG: PH domain-containing protein [Clostridiales bacterium]|nr:PH domain-containing protein [Clostridiales bacterium]